MIPKAPPFELSRDGNHTLAVRIAGDLIDIIEPEQSVADAGANAADVADVTTGPAWPAWWLETHPYQLPLPEGWTARASSGADPSVFDLVGPYDSLIFVQVPRRIPPIDQIVAPGQELIGQGSFAAGEWVAVQYMAAGCRYVQRHALVRIGEMTAVVTVQSPAEAFSLVAPIHEHLADALQPGRA